MNLTGLHKMIMDMGLESTFNSTMELVITPITGIILFTLGYELKFEKEMLSSLLRLAIVRLVLCSIIIALFYVVFPALVSEKALRLPFCFTSCAQLDSQFHFRYRRSLRVRMTRAICQHLSHYFL